MKYYLFLALFCFSLIGLANKVETKNVDSIQYQIAKDDEVLMMIDQLMHDKYYNAFGFCEDSIGFMPPDSIPPLNEQLLKSRLNELNLETPFDLRYNDFTKAFINLYVNKKRDLSKSVLHLAPLYFPMIEEVLDRYEIPLELKYLAIVESALSNKARSRVGAQGLWQFMYRTGKMYGLNVTSYYDDRMDPYKSTVAACLYLKDLYALYGDWSLVLAAYNSGPGNVNKAIRRSGGQKDYWKIRPFLPRETRGYVPAFIAVNYMMRFAEEHNLYPKDNQLLSYNVDTVKIQSSISFEQLSHYLDVSKEELEFYNPTYKLSFIPKSKEKETHFLCLPQEKIGLYLVNEKAIYADIRRVEIADSIAGKKKQSIMPEHLVHRVRSGEFLGYIAEKYHCRVRDIMVWNNLSSSRINPGDRLIVYTTKKPTSTNEPKAVQTVAAKTVQSGKYKFHVVRSGDTLWDIAKLYGETSVNDLKRMNSDLNFKRLKPGMKVKIKEIG